MSIMNIIERLLTVLICVALVVIVYAYSSSQALKYAYCDPRSTTHLTLSHR